MTTLLRLIQDDNGDLFKADGIFMKSVHSREINPCGKIRTIVLENPSLDVEEEIRKWAEKYPSSVPKFANSYVISDFNGGTQKVVKDDKGKERVLSIYALQFYFAGL